MGASTASSCRPSQIPDEFPADSLADLETAWYAAVSAGDAGFMAFHEQVSAWNDPGDLGFCPLP